MKKLEITKRPRKTCVLQIPSTEEEANKIKSLAKKHNMKNSEYLRILINYGIAVSGEE